MGKIIKDSIHGYIEIDDFFINIIDTIEFQRLKWIEQGSFRVLYPAARHDRFIHSLGVYHLAELFCEYFFNNLKQDLDIHFNESTLLNLKRTFLYASLLHDIGHAPFSHTCEHYFEIAENDQGQKKINVDLLEAIRSINNIADEKVERFEQEFNEINGKPSPHEVISATILIRQATKFLGDNYEKIDLELAARMVLGCTYQNKDENSDEIGVSNCLIRFLNSATIDVDKLDYITRDAKMSGFDNITIDIHRLARSVSATKNVDGDIFPAFRKTALSVIDNVLRAKSEENQWMISHPVVVYECGLLKTCIDKIASNSSLEKDEFIKKLFSIEALSNGNLVIDKTSFKLLSDVDILKEFKNSLDDENVGEYFERKRRRRPVWKSYHEYVYLFEEPSIKESANIVFRYFKPLITFMKTQKLFVLDSKSYKEIKEQASKIKNPANFLKEFAKAEDLPFDFVLLEAKSSFAPKLSADEIFINFPSLPKPSIGCVTYGFLTGQSMIQSNENDFFYLYTKGRINIESFQAKVRNDIARRYQNI